MSKSKFATDEKQKAVKVPDTAAMYQYLGRITLDWIVIVNRLKILIRRMEDEGKIDEAERTKFGLKGTKDGMPLVDRFVCCCEKHLGLPCEDCKKGLGACRRHGAGECESYKTCNHAEFIQLLRDTVHERNALMHDMGDEAQKVVPRKRREHWASGNHKPLEKDEYGYDSVIVATLWGILRKNDTSIIKAGEMSLHFKRWMECDYYMEFFAGDQPLPKDWEKED